MGTTLKSFDALPRLGFNPVSATRRVCDNALIFGNKPERKWDYNPGQKARAKVYNRYIRLHGVRPRKQTVDKLLAAQTGPIEVTVSELRRAGKKVVLVYVN